MPARNEPIQSGLEPLGEEDRQGEHGNPGQQTEGQTESETPPPTSAGDRVTLGTPI
jgi:hypothetical protein